MLEVACRARSFVLLGMLQGLLTHVVAAGKQAGQAGRLARSAVMAELSAVAVLGAACRYHNITDASYDSNRYMY